MKEPTVEEMVELLDDLETFDDHYLWPKNWLEIFQAIKKRLGKTGVSRGWARSLIDELPMPNPDDPWSTQLNFDFDKQEKYIIDKLAELGFGVKKTKRRN